MSNTKTSSHRPLPQNISDALARALRVRRAASTLTQEDLAAAGRVSVQMVRRLEAGTANPTLGTLHAIATPLGVTLSDLLKEAGA